MACVASAGYFEALHVTAEDRERAELYRANAERDALRSSATDMESFLKALQMELTWSEFDEQNLKCIVQLINKTNQFNLTTQRYTEADVASMMRDPDVIALQLRLTDSYGDNGIIGVIIGRLSGNGVLGIDTWLMSCRVLGRKVEEATLNIVPERAVDLGCDVLMGSYRPTAKNGMVAAHYGRLVSSSSVRMQMEAHSGALGWRSGSRRMYRCELWRERNGRCECLSPADRNLSGGL